MKFLLLLSLGLSIPSSWAKIVNKEFSRFAIERSSLVGKKTIALTFDDGPNTTSTPAILDTLKKYNVKATFFVLGKLSHANPEMMKRISEEGHLVSNHTYSHPALGGLSMFKRNKVAKDEILRTHEEIEGYLNAGDRLFFRAPENSWHKNIAGALNKDSILRQYVGPVMWDVGGSNQIVNGKIAGAADWACWSKKWTVDECMMGYISETERKKGGIVLMHDIHAKTAYMLEGYIQVLLSRGYKFVTLNDVESLK